MAEKAASRKSDPCAFSVSFFSCGFGTDDLDVGLSRDLQRSVGWPKRISP